jgi:hypothetical protein
MNNVKKLLVVISLTITLAGTTLADCPAPIPGEVNTPPCTAAQQFTDEPADQTTTAATISNAVQVVVLNVIINGLENLLTVY